MAVQPRVTIQVRLHPLASSSFLHPSPITLLLHLHVAHSPAATHNTVHSPRSFSLSLFISLPSLPADHPAAGIHSHVDDERNYPYSRNDHESFVAPSNTLPTPTNSGAKTQVQQRMYRSDLVRSALTNTPHPNFQPMSDSAHSGHQSGQGRQLTTPVHEQATTSEHFDRLAQSRNRKTYDAASFCVEGPRRRLKSGPGWEGPPAYRNGESSSCNPALYSTHRFHLKGHHKPSVRAGTDGMLRSLGFHHAADTTAAGAPSSVQNRYIEFSASMNRGPALTVNSAMMNPKRNPVTGHNMGNEYVYGPGERKISRKRMGQATEAEYHNRRGEDGNVTTHTRMFGDNYVECHKPQTGLKTSFENDGSGAGGNGEGINVVDAHRTSKAKGLLFPESKRPIDHDRRSAAAEYQQQLWQMHEELPSYGEAQMIRNKYGY